MIEQPNPLSLSRQCQLLGLSRAALYYRPVEVSDYELELMALIDRQYLRTPFYGSRRMTAWLRTQGHLNKPTLKGKWQCRCKSAKSTIVETLSLSLVCGAI